MKSPFLLFTKVILLAGCVAVVATAMLFSGCSTPSRLSSTPSPLVKKQWIPLFSGTSTAAFRGYKRDKFPDNVWKVQDGMLKTVPGNEKVDLITREKFTDFELELEWKVAHGGNSGVFYRVAETEGPAWNTGVEMQILDDNEHPDGKNPKTSAGALYALIAPDSSKHLNPVGEFNKARVVFKKGHVEHWLNGKKVVDYDWNSPKVKKLIAESKFKTMPLFMQQSEGYVALQHHGQEAWFRNVRIRRL